MDVLHIFGLDLDIRPGGIIERPSAPYLEVVTVCEWSCRVTDGVASLRWWLRIARTHSLYLELSVAIEQQPSRPGHFYPRAGVMKQPARAALMLWQGLDTELPEEEALFVSSGDISLGTRGLPDTSVKGKAIRPAPPGSFAPTDVFFYVQPSLALTSPRNSPLSISTGEGGFRLDLSAPGIEFEPRAFGVTTTVGIEVEGASGRLEPKVLTSQKHLSEGVRFSLREPIRLQEPPARPGAAGRPRLRFLPDKSDAQFPLYPDLLSPSGGLSRDNPVIIPLKAAGYGLLVSWNAAPKPQVTQLALTRGGADGFLLYSHGLADTYNEPVVWRVGEDLSLHARVDAGRRPTGLLFAPLPEGRSVALTPVGLDGPVHGVTQKSRFRPQSGGRLVCDRRIPSAAGVNSSVAADITSEFTVPWIDFAGHQRFEHPKPGASYVSAGGGGAPRGPHAGAAEEAASRVQTFTFAGEGMALPLLPAQSFNAPPRRPYVKELYTRINARFARQEHDLGKTRHETFLIESPVGKSESLVKVSEVFRPPADGAAVLSAGTPPPKEIKLNEYAALRDYGKVKVRLRVNPEESPDYVLMHAGDTRASFVDSHFDFFLDPKQKAFRLKSQPGGLPLAGGAQPLLSILKLSQRLSLAEIFEEAGLQPSDEKFLPEVVDATVRAREWVGLVMFCVPVGADLGMEPLSTLTPKNLTLAYLAISPQKEGCPPGETECFSINARAIWDRTKPACGAGPAAPGPTDPVPVPAGDDKETSFQLNYIDVAWHNSELAFYHSEADLKFGSFFGIAATDDPLKIIGSYDRPRNEIRFVGQFAEPLEVFEAPPAFGPIKNVKLRGAEIKFVNGETAIHLDGQMDLQKFWVFDVGDQAQVDFRELQIRLKGEIADGIPRRFALDYPSFKLKVNVPPLRLGFLEAKLGSIGVDWNGLSFPWESIAPIKAPQNPLGKGVLLLDVRLELMKLPKLAVASVDRLIIDFTIGLGRGDSGVWSLDNMRVGARALAFDKLKLDLMRFLTLSAERGDIVGQPVDGQTINWLRLLQINVTILNKKIIEGLSVWFYSAPGNRRGFIAYLPPPEPAPPGGGSPEKPDGDGGGAKKGGLLEIHWVLIGQNVELGDTLARQIMALEVPSRTGGTSQGTDIAKGIDDRFRNVSDNCADSLIPCQPEATRGEWIFAAGFTFLKVLEGKFLFQDNAYYGICLGGPIFKEWFGFDFAISVLYIKGRQPAQDAFFVSVRVPQITLSNFMFMGGVIALEISMDGSFLLDVGFPWVGPGGARQWDRTLGLIVKIYQGMGGLYIGRRHLTEQFDGGGLCLSGGYAAEFGFGRSSNDGTLRVWATIGVYYILEGKFHLLDGKIMGGSLRGAVGILGRAAAELNWWIISVRVEIFISAESGTTLEWGTLCTAAAAEPKPRLVLDYDFYAGVRAEACVGSGWFKLCKSISVTAHLHFSHTIPLGD